MNQNATLTLEDYHNAHFPSREKYELFLRKYSRNNLLNILPQNVFETCFMTSVFYGSRDVVALLLLFASFRVVEQMNVHFAILATAYAVYVNVAGFFMWCIWVVGHDCGHGTFCKDEWINCVFGHIFYGMILVPFYPWKRSHDMHHNFQNDKKRDFSHPWHAPNSRADKSYGLFFRIVVLVYGWTFYLFIGEDGCHFWPFQGKLWANANQKEKIKCFVSTVVVVIWIALYMVLLGGFLPFMKYAYIPICVSGIWVTMVTYLQHHGEDTSVFTKESFHFELAAFETIDRKYGFWVDEMHHNISDCHVIHHLLATKIPHYHLKEATKALKQSMEKDGLHHLMKQEDTYDFFPRFIKNMIQKGYTFQHYVKKSL